MTNNKGIIKAIIGLFFLSIIFFFTRIQNLDSIPVFGDEAIYIRWSQIIKNEETLRFVPVTDGKQPLFMWIVAVLLKFNFDPVLTARFVSILAGWGIIIGIFLVTTIIFNYSDTTKNIKKFLLNSVNKYYYIGLIAVLIYIFLPFSFFFDRLALADNLLSFFGVWSLLISFLLAKYNRLDISLILGTVLGFAWLTKSPAMFFIILSFLTFLIYNHKNVKTYIYPFISLIIAFCIYNILRLGPQFHMIALRNKDYLWSISDIITHPLDPLKSHLIAISNIYLHYISWPVILIAVIGLVIFFKKYNNDEKTKYIVLTLWWLLPLLASAMLTKVFTARYILYTLQPLIIILGIGIFYFFVQLKSVLKNSILNYLILILIFLSNFNWIYQISTKPQNSILPSSETGYLYDWTSGWGIKESAAFLKSRSKEANVIVGTEGYFGTLPDGLLLYSDGTKQLTIFGVGLEFYTIPEKLIDAKNHGDEVYILINKSRLFLIEEEAKKLSIVKEYSKPGNDSLLLMRLL